jgi:hypothetical protein
MYIVSVLILDLPFPNFNWLFNYLVEYELFQFILDYVIYCHGYLVHMLSCGCGRCSVCARFVLCFDL